MGSWDFRRESTQPQGGANTALQGKHGYQPYYEAQVLESKRNVIATSKGWVKRVHGTGGQAGRVKEEVIVAANPGVAGLSYVSNTHLGAADIGQIYLDDRSLNSNGNINAETTANLNVVFNEPLVFNAGTAANNLTLTVANTVSGNHQVATCQSGDSTTLLNANNTLVFQFTPNTAAIGTYQVNAQSISVVGGGNPLYNPEEGNNVVSTANLTVTGVVSNTLGTFTVE